MVKLHPLVREQELYSLRPKNYLIRASVVSYPKVFQVGDDRTFSQI